MRLISAAAITFIALLVSNHLCAVPLTEGSIKSIEKGAKIGLYSATFDPFTKEHLKVVEAALKSGHFSHVVVVPTDFNILKRKATDLRLRYQFLAAEFKDNPKVLYPTFDQFSSKRKKVRSTMIFLRDHKLKTMGIVQQSDLKGLLGFFKRLAIAYRLRVDSWLVSVPNEKQYKKFPFTIFFRNREPLYLPDPPSSRKVRNYFANRPQLYDDTLRNRPKDLPVSDAVFEIIRKNNIYKK